MEFTPYGADEYRNLDDQAFDERRNLVIDLLGVTELPEGVTTDQLMAERDLIMTEVERRNTLADLREAKVKNVLSACKVIATTKKDERKEVDPFDTPEYRNAFMELACRHKQMPEEFRTGIYAQRADQHTMTTDTPVMIPTTLSNRIIEELEVENGIYSRVTKLNVKGGLDIPVLSLKPVAHWVGETEISDTQKFTADVTISFSYYELECRLSQTMLESIVTFDEFQRRFVPAVVKAMRDAVEVGVIAGTGTGQMLGITNDERVTNSVSMTAAQVKDWKAWRKIVKKAIPRAYRNGSYIMGQGTWDAYVETFADDSNAPISIGYNPVTGNEVLSFMGSEVILVDDSLIADFDTAGDGDVFVIYGKLSDYAINTNQQLQTVQYTDWDDRKVKTVAYMVLDGKVLDPSGFVLVKKSA